jgi:hypothetical protein
MPRLAVVLSDENGAPSVKSYVKKDVLALWLGQMVGAR